MRRRLLLGLGAALVVVLLALAFFALAQPVKVLPRMALAPGFVLTDQQGARLSSEELRGSIVLYSFTYAGCAEECAAHDAVLRAVRERLDMLDTGGVPVRLVSISFDAARGTPAALAAAAAARGADGERWRFAGSTDAARLKAVVGGGFRVYYEPQPDGRYRFDPALVLVDGWGLVRAEHRVGLPAPDALLAQLALLGAEIRASTGVARLAYEAAHLFACYAY